MADIDLPVFSFRPNHREPMVERLAFLTDVLRASKGAEQRRSLRETPRRSFDADFLLVGPERTFWDLFMNSVGGQEVMVPLYWEVVSLGAGLTAGVSSRINFDTTYTEWPYFDGGLALVAGDTAFDWEVVEITGVDVAGIDLASPVTKAWNRGAKLYPLRRSVVEDFGDLGHASAAVATTTARIRQTAANPWTPAADPATIYAGLPVLDSEPNWVADLDVDMAREIALLDTQVGRTYQVDTLGRFFIGQSHRYFLQGRQAMAIFRDLLYRRKGRTGGFWLPTFKADFKLAATAGSAATQLEVENVGFQYAGGPQSGREYIAIRHSAGTIYRKILDVIPGTTSATEKLVLDAAAGLDLSPGLVRKISFMDTARFDADEFEIVHHAGADSLHECDTTFRTYKNTRTSPEPIYAPIALTGESSVPCGTPREPVAGLPWTDRGTDYFIVGGAQEISGTLTNFQRWFHGHIDSLRVTKGIARYKVDQYNVPGADFPSDSVDPYWANVITLLKFNGEDGATESVCEKGNPVVHNGGAALDTAIKKFGLSSCYFDGVDDYIRDTVGNSGQALGETFTIEAWVRPASYLPSNNSGGDGYGRPILGVGPVSVGGNDTTVGIWGTEGQVKYGMWGPFEYSFAPMTQITTDLETAPLNQWSFVSVCRDGLTGLFYLHVNGKLATSVDAPVEVLP